MKTIARLLVVPFLLTACSSGAESGATTADALAETEDAATTPVDEGVETVAGDATRDDASAADSIAPETAVDAAVDSAPEATTDAALSASRARIHEVYVDRALEGDLVEWIEISAPPTTPIDTLWIRVIDKSGAPVLSLRVADAGTKMKTSGFWVVGSNAVVKVDKGYDPKTTWGLPNDGGSIQLTNNEGVAIALLDVLGYGTAPATTATEPKKTIETAAATLPPSGSKGKTLGRRSVPGDSDDNSKDFCVMTASPGAANGSCP